MAEEILYAERQQHCAQACQQDRSFDTQQQTAGSQTVNQSVLLVPKHEDQSPIDCPVFFIRHMGQARVSQPCDARISMVIDYAVEGAIDAVTDIVIHDPVAAAVLSHPSPVDVE